LLRRSMCADLARDEYKPDQREITCKKSIEQSAKCHPLRVSAISADASTRD